MSNFRTPPQDITWLKAAVKQLQSRLNKITSGSTIISSGTGGGNTGVLEDHDHTGTSSGGALTGSLHDSFDEFAEIAAPGTPAAGRVRIYAKADGNFYQKDDAGLETSLASASATEHHTLAAGVDPTVASTTVPYKLVGPMAAAGTITGVEAVAGDNKTNGATSAIFDIHKILAASKNTDGQGTTIFTTQANRPTITNGNKLSTITLPDVTAFAAGDWMAIYCDQSGTNLTDATVGMRFTNP